AYGPQNDVTLKMPAFEWVHVQLHQQKGMISLSPPTICNSAVLNTTEHQSVGTPVRHGKLLTQSGWAGGITAIPFPAARCLFVASGNGSTPTVE
ncbi:hypothetical protein, partial [Citrobacter portucalensis]|uniref:hypothetical protein n=1 Tax=Citrobacter portucalensis TaxID=1639133 RepID=UPI003B429CF7